MTHTPLIRVASAPGLLALSLVLLATTSTAGAQPAPRMTLAPPQSLSVDGKPVRAMALDAAGKALAAVTLDARSQAELHLFDLSSRRKQVIGLGTVKTVWGVHFAGPIGDETTVDGAVYLSYDTNRFTVYRRAGASRLLPFNSFIFESQARRRDYSDMSNSNAVGLATQRGPVTVLGRRLCTSSQETAVVLTTSGLTVKTYVEHDSQVRILGCGFARGQNLVVVDTAEVSVRNLEGPAKRRAVRSSDPLLAMAINPAQDALAVATATTVQTYSLPDLKAGLRFRLAAPIMGPTRIAYLQDGKLLLVGRVGDSTIHEATTGAVAATVKGVQGALIFASEDGRTVTYLHTDGTIKVMASR